jgi:hypothetical protein
LPVAFCDLITGLPAAARRGGFFEPRDQNYCSVGKSAVPGNPCITLSQCGYPIYYDNLRNYQARLRICNFSYECLGIVYPRPVWTAAYHRPVLDRNLLDFWEIRSKYRQRTMNQDTKIIERLDNKLFDIEKEVEEQLYWRTLTSESTNPEVVLRIMGEVMLEIGSYQTYVNEAVFTAVGRLGRSIDEQGLIRAMIAVQIEEVGHGSLAQADFTALGGDPKLLANRRPSPQAQALIGTVRNLGEREHPLCHLGFMYFFEKFTTIMTNKVTPTLERAAYPDDRLQFMRLHAEEDIRHADMLANVITECISRYEHAGSHIEYGFDSFRVVYPHPVWSAAFKRATDVK